MQGKLSNKVEQSVAENARLTPTLQHKRSGASGKPNAASGSKLLASIALGEKNITIGSGTDQRDGNRRLCPESGLPMVSEIINGTKYVYVGFDTVGIDAWSLQNSYASNAGDCKFIFKSGTYDVGGEFALNQGQSITAVMTKMVLEI